MPGIALGMSHLPGSPLTAGELNKASATGSMAPGTEPVPKRTIGDRGQSLRAAIVRQPNRHVEERVADLGIADVQVLIGQEAEELVFDDGAAHSSAQGVAVQLRILIVRRNGLVLIEEEGRGIEPVGGAMQIERFRDSCSCRRWC